MQIQCIYGCTYVHIYVTFILHLLSYNIVKIYLLSKCVELHDDLCSQLLIIVNSLSPVCHCVYMRLFVLTP